MGMKRGAEILFEALGLMAFLVALFVVAIKLAPDAE